MKIAGHSITRVQLATLHGLYQGLIENHGSNTAKLYGKNVARQLNTLADNGIISRGGQGYFIPWTGAGADIIAATPDVTISVELSGGAR
jgi:hypothetical protein